MEPFNEEKYFDEVCEENEENIEKPKLLWDYYIIGGRYCGLLKLKVETEKENEYDWNYLVSFNKGPRCGRLFHSSILKHLLEKKSYYTVEEDYFNYMGFRDGFLYVDGAKISDIININNISCFGFIDIDGEPYVREEWDSKNSKFIENINFDEEYKNKLKEYSNYYLTVLDIHD
jgi:hypothetical protein